jgi:hypothetical protein
VLHLDRVRSRSVRIEIRKGLNSRLPLRVRAPRSVAGRTATAAGYNGRAAPRFKRLEALVLASQFLLIFLLLLRSTLEPWRSTLRRSRDLSCGAQRRRRCGPAPRGCVGSRHSLGCFGAFCPPCSGNCLRSDILSLPPESHRCWSIEYNADVSLSYISAVRTNEGKLNRTESALCAQPHKSAPVDT